MIRKNILNNGAMGVKNNLQNKNQNCSSQMKKDYIANTATLLMG